MRIAKRRRIYNEALNPFFGYFYTIKKTLKKAATKYQKIELVQTDEFGKVLLLDDITQVAEKNDFMYHEPMVHPALICHPKPENILVIGGGDGGILREVLKYPVVKRVELAELDDGVVKFSKKYLGTVHDNCFDDPRVNVNIVDGRKFTEEHPGEFDVVIMDMTDPFGPSKLLYTKEFYRIIKKSFRNRAGMFVMHSESPVSRPLAFSSIYHTLSSVFENVNPLYMYIQMYAVLWSVCVASEQTDISAVKASVLQKKIARYGLKNLKMFNAKTHQAMLVPFPYISEILTEPGRIITDAKPDFPDNFIS